MADTLQEIPIWSIPRPIPTATPPFIPGGMGGILPQVLQKYGYGQSVPMGASPTVAAGGRFAGPKWLQKIATGFDKFIGTPALPANATPEQQALAQQQRAVMLRSLMGASQPYVAGTQSPLGALSNALLHGQQGQQQLAADALRAKLMKAQVQAAQQQANKPIVVSPGGAVVNPQTGQEIYQNPATTGGNSRYGSPQIMESGRIAALDRATGRLQYTDSGEAVPQSDKASANLKIISLPDGSQQIVNMRPEIGNAGNPQTGTGQRTESLVSPEQAIAGAAAKSQAEAGGAKIGAGLAERQLSLPQAQAHLSATNQKMDRLAAAATELLNDQNLWKAVGIGRGLSAIPSSAGADVKAKIKNLQSQAGLAVLQDMRDNSKTGGAVGQVSNFEQQLLQDNLAALSDLNQSPEAFRQQLEKIVQFTDQSKQRFQGAFFGTYPELYQQQSGTSKDVSQMSDDELRAIINGD